MQTINSWKDLSKAFPMDREDMTIEQCREYINHSFRLYEQDGFAKIFWTPYQDYSSYIGHPFIVVRRLTENEADIECLPMWRIRFEDGTETDAYPEEIIQEEMIRAGCPFTFDKLKGES